ncbi:hypothetical protein [Butyrivibrio sp. FCS014]|uniref:hypothetical protein n=1 Tax=Butyrivibrio sp. FCS014 TaxID=1408304 RepID=UPI00055CED30|nr:hypothetical protein [Butyrivibrio sp. FCS014]
MEATLLTGCANASHQGSAATTDRMRLLPRRKHLPATEEAPAPEAAATEVEHFILHHRDPVRMICNQDLISTFESKNPGITVEYIAAGTISSSMDGSLCQ